MNVSAEGNSSGEQTSPLSSLFKLRYVTWEWRESLGSLLEFAMKLLKQGQGMLLKTLFDVKNSKMTECLRSEYFCSLHFLPPLFFGVWGAYPATFLVSVLRGNSWRVPGIIWVPGIEPKLATCKASSLPAVLLFQPYLHFSSFIEVWLTCTKLYIFSVHNSKLGKCKYMKQFLPLIPRTQPWPSRVSSHCYYLFYDFMCY